MRLYIKTVSRGNNHDTFELTSTIEGAWNWNVYEQPARFCRWIVGWGGIFVKSPITGETGFCTDFRVEPRPQGGFAVSCQTSLWCILIRRISSRARASTKITINLRITSGLRVWSRKSYGGTG